MVAMVAIHVQGTSNASYSVLHARSELEFYIHIQCSSLPFSMPCYDMLVHVFLASDRTLYSTYIPAQLLKSFVRALNFWSEVSWFNALSTFVGYLMPKPSFERNSSDAF